MDPGERVSGPMAVFDRTLYFMTFDAATGNTNACSQGEAHLYGRDYVMPITNTPPFKGGLLSLPAAGTNPFLAPDASDPTLKGKVIPGVSIQQTTACVALGAAARDQYVPGAMHASATTFTAGSYSLVAQVGKGNTTNGAPSVGTYTMPLATPAEPTVINSWASVTE
jgi:hypothetical protein